MESRWFIPNPRLDNFDMGELDERTGKQAPLEGGALSRGDVAEAKEGDEDMFTG